MSDFFEQKHRSSFGKSVIFPFISGILGASLVVGICFGVPSIKNKLIPSNTNTENTTIKQNSIETSTNQTTNLDTSSLNSLEAFSEATTTIAKKVQPSIVGITVEYSVNTFFGTNGTVSASGSGVIVSEDGYILTNNHVVNSSSTSSFYQLSDATSIKVSLYNDSTPYEAKIVGTDELTDLAVIKIEKSGLIPAELGSSDSVEVGAFAMAIGTPLGLESSVTTGIVSATNREITDSDGKKYILIQTDAAINSGNSGGALVNSYGQVVGINTLKASGSGIEGISFAIPINSAKSIYTELIEYGKVKRPYIGIGTVDVTEQLAEYYNLPVGVYIKSIEDFSAAQKAGLKVGDIITQVDETTVTTLEELNKIKYTHSIGDTIKLKVVRDNQELDISLTLGESK